jgi:hypothetical protein
MSSSMSCDPVKRIDWSMPSWLIDLVVLRYGSCQEGLRLPDMVDVHPPGSVGSGQCEREMCEMSGYPSRQISAYGRGL